MNITGVNYLSNATENNIVQAGNNNQLQVIVPSNLSSKEAGIALLRSLRAGDTFTGEIINITQNEITLSLGDNVSINATLADALSYNIGDKASFSVKENNQERIILKSNVNPELKNLMNEQTITTALRNANIAVNETTVDLVSNLMKQGQPIDAKSLHQALNAMDKTPTATPMDVAILTRMNLEVNEQNVSALHSYMDYEQGMSSQTTKLTGSLSNALISTENASQASDLLMDVLSSYSETISDVEPLNAFIKNESMSNLKAQLNNLIPKDGNLQAVNNLVNKLNEGNITAKEFLTDFAQLIKGDNIEKDAVNTVLKCREFNEVLNDFIRQEMYIKPEDVNHENISKLFSKLLKDKEALFDKLSNKPVMSEFLQNNQNISNNIEFVNNINHFMNFVQIPLKMSGQNAHGDLYVYKNNKKSFEDKDELKAFLHLDMEHLGALDVLVKLKNNNVSTNFKVETEEILDYIEAHMDELNAALNKLGYNVTSTVDLNNTPYSFKNDVIEKEFPPMDIKRFSFDVRA
jgi:flagellar hook-length control protein FliK